ncbi:MAG: hypothetical protein VX733_03355 [Candidatus Latescibacterota bacterium]|nr:hypothetical protein [Candidatus Latescibacterota bacterium]
MPTRKQITDTLRDRFTDVAEKGKTLGQALRVRADMAATRRRLRVTYSEIGEEVYRRLRDGEMECDHRLLSLKEQVDGLKAEVRLREAELREIMHSGFRPPERESVGADEGVHR